MKDYLREKWNFPRKLRMTCYALPELSARWGARGSLVGRQDSGDGDLRHVGLGHAGWCLAVVTEVIEATIQSGRNH